MAEEIQANTAVTEAPDQGVDVRDTFGEGADAPMPEPVYADETDDAVESDGAVEETETKESAESAETESDWLDGESLRRAQSYGLTPDEARQYGSIAALQGAMTQIDRLLLRRQSPPQQAAPTTPPGPPARTQEAETPKTESGEPAFDFNLDPDLVEPEVVKATSQFRQAHEYTKGRLARAEAMIEMLHGVIANQQAERVANEFKGWVGELGDDGKDLYGDGDLTAMQPDTPMAKAVGELKATVVGLRQAYESAGLTVPPDRELWTRAYQALRGDKLLSNAKTAARKELVSEIQKRQGTSGAKPTHKKGRALSPEEEAKAFWRAGIAGKNVGEAEDNEV